MHVADIKYDLRCSYPLQNTPRSWETGKGGGGGQGVVEREYVGEMGRKSASEQGCLVWRVSWSAWQLRGISLA